MSNVRNPRAKWVLPLVVDPPTHTDWCIPVPDDPFHRAAFLGALQNLGAAYLWQDDLAHTAKQVARVWRNIIDNLEKCMEQEPPKGSLLEDFMPLRVDCDCNVWVTCCDGTEKQLLTSDQVKALIAGPAQPGAPQPAPGGGCQQYSIAVTGSQLQIIPTIVSSGDTIQIVSADGASSLDGVTGWYCPDGETYFAGACIGGTGGTSGSNVEPGSNTGSLVIYIDGVYYSGVGTFTVPGGVVNKTPMLAINYPTGSDASGTLQATVKVCNNSAAVWTSVLDFRAQTYSAIVTINHGSWVAGLGYKSVTLGLPDLDDVDILINFVTNAVMTSLELQYDSTAAGAGADNSVQLFPPNGSGPVLSGTNTFVATGPYATQHTIGAAIDSGTAAATMYLQKLTIHGTGAKPAALP